MLNLKHVKVKFKVFAKRFIIKQLMYVTLIGDANLQFYHIWLSVDEE